MIHAKATKPRIFPWNSARAPEQIDRAQELGGDLTLNQTKLYEIGRDGKLGVHKETPGLALSLRQYEYGTMAFWRALANQIDPSLPAAEDVTLEDLKSTYFDISAYLTDDNGSFQGTIWLPKLRVNGFTIDIGDPDAVVERSFDLVGEDYKVITDNYFAYQTATVVAPGDESVILSPVPILYAASKYIYRVLRVRAGVCTELIEDESGPFAADTWSYDNPTVTVLVQDCLAGDIIKIYYPSATAYATLWTDNNADAAGLYADQVSIFLKIGAGTDAQIYRLQSASIDVAFERTDYKEIGNAEVVQTGVKSKTVTVALGRILEDFTLEEILRGTSVYPYIDSRSFSSNITLTVKIYTDNTKASFKMGYKITGLSPTALSTGSTIEDYDTQNNTLESDNFLVTPDETEL